MIDGLPTPELAACRRLCGWTPAPAHARIGDRIAIAAHLGRDEAFPGALADFAARYADQDERDRAASEGGWRSGRIPVEPGL